MFLAETARKHQPSFAGSVWSRGTQILGGSKKYKRVCAFMNIKYFPLYIRLNKNKSNIKHLFHF